MIDNNQLKTLKDLQAFMEGHFILSSGLHSPFYIQCAKIFEQPWKVDHIIDPLVEKIKLKELDIDKIVSPAFGGIFFGYEIARRLQLTNYFAERVEGEFQLRRSFAVNPGEKILVTEDVVTTGKSAMEVVELLRSRGARPVAVVCIANRSGKSTIGDNLPIIEYCNIPLETYSEDHLPQWLAERPAIKPGSRNQPLKKKVA